MGFTATTVGWVSTLGILASGATSPPGGTARKYAPFRPVMKLALIAAPVEALYSPRVPLRLSATKRLLPKSARPTGPFRLVMKLALIAAPVVALYSPTVPALISDTKRILAEIARPTGRFWPLMKLALI